MLGIEKCFPTESYKLGTEQEGVSILSLSSNVRSYKRKSLVVLNFATLTCCPIVGLTSYTGVISSSHKYRYGIYFGLALPAEAYSLGGAPDSRLLYPLNFFL